jgi:hypothetical protein
MLKLAEFTSDTLIYHKLRHNRRYRYEFININEVLSAAQLFFLESKNYHIRPHPSNSRKPNNSRVYELFFEADSLTELDDTIICLLFDNARFK